MPIFSATDSKIKLVFCLKTEYKHLKKQHQSTNKLVNPVYYSKLRDNKLDQFVLANKLLRNTKSIKNLDIYNKSNVIIAYNNYNNTEIDRVYP